MASAIILAQDDAVRASFTISKRIKSARGDAKEAERSRPERKDAQGKDYCAMKLETCVHAQARRHVRCECNASQVALSLNSLCQSPYAPPPSAAPANTRQGDGLVNGIIGIFVCLYFTRLYTLANCVLYIIGRAGVFWRVTLQPAPVL